MGISYGDTLPWLSPDALGATLDDAVAVGVGWIRLDLSWNDVQRKGPGAYSWAGFDQVVAAANARNLRILAVLAYTPQWARNSACPGTSKCPPGDPGQFAAFAAAAASRYGPQGVHSWEIWNEPNSGHFWAPQADVAGYLALLRATAPAIRAADASAFLISGGLAPASSRDINLSQLDYLNAFCAQGGPGLVDAIGYHPYSFPVLPDYNQHNAWAEISTTPASFQSVLASAGYPNMRIWATEYGAPTNGPGVAADTSDYHLNLRPDHVTEALQAAMATESVQLARGSGMISALFWYTAQDAGTDPSTIENFFGLRRADGSAKPAYGALQAAIATGG